MFILVNELVVGPSSSNVLVDTKVEITKQFSHFLSPHISSNKFGYTLAMTFVDLLVLDDLHHGRSRTSSGDITSSIQPITRAMVPDLYSGPPEDQRRISLSSSRRCLS